MNGRFATVMAVLMIGSFGFAVWSLNESHKAVVARAHDQAALNAERARRAAHDRMILCHATNRSNKALRSVLRLAKAGVSPPFAHELSRAQKDAYAAAYGRALLLTRPVDCSRLDPPNRKDAHVVFD